MEKVSDPVEREWYVRQTVERGWSRNILALQVENQVHRRVGKATSNFPKTLRPADDLLRHGDDRPTIGLLLVRQKNRVLVEYALRGLRKPVGAADWETRLTRTLPRDLAASLPSIEEIEAELRGHATRR